MTSEITQELSSNIVFFEQKLLELLESMEDGFLRSLAASSYVANESSAYWGTLQALGLIFRFEEKEETQKKAFKLGKSLVYDHALYFDGLLSMLLEELKKTIETPFLAVDTDFVYMFFSLVFAARDQIENVLCFFEMDHPWKETVDVVDRIGEVFLQKNKSILQKATHTNHMIQMQGLLKGEGYWWGNLEGCLN